MARAGTLLAARALGLEVIDQEIVLKIKMHARDTLVLSPGEVYDMPDYIADQLLRRGKATLVEEPVKSKSKKE
jgi:hypothetical protein